VAKKVVISVPKNKKEANGFLMRIGKEQRAIAKIESGLNTKVDNLKTGAVAASEPHELEIAQLVEGLFAYAQVNRDKLTDDGKRKTVKVPAGEFGWRFTPRKVNLTNVKSVLKTLHTLNLTQFIRPGEETVNKEEMLKQREVAEGVEGVSINRHEEFIAKPAVLKVEIVTKVDKLKKATSK